MHMGKNLSNDKVRENFHRDITPNCNTIEPGAHAPHSLRSGGASEASNNGVSDLLLAGKHGRWKSGYTRDRYIKDNKRIRLGVTKTLGL